MVRRALETPELRMNGRSKKLIEETMTPLSLVINLQLDSVHKKKGEKKKNIKAKGRTRGCEKYTSEGLYNSLTIRMSQISLIRACLCRFYASFFIIIRNLHYTPFLLDMIISNFHSC